MSRLALARASPGAGAVPSILVAAAAFIAGTVLAAHHPVAPGPVLVAFVAWCAAAWRWPGSWLLAVPACLPAASFGPWTGWIAFEEFDLVLLGALAAGYAWRAGESPGTRENAPAADEPGSRRLLFLALLCATTHVVAVVHGATPTGAPSFGWFDGYREPINSLRVGKSELFVLLFLPLMGAACRRSPTATMRSVACGMIVGTSVVAGAVLWERAHYPGLFDFSTPYRTVALFWEMHVGGAAIDAYLAMAVPFVAWSVLQARTPVRFAAAATLALLVEYACLTTFSRGVYLAVGGGLLVMGVLVGRRSSVPGEIFWRRPASALLMAAMALEIAAVFGSDSFMLSRLNRSERDLVGRLEHWREGIGVLQGAAEWALGAGVGRFPAEHAALVPRRGFPGEARAIEDGAGRAWLRLRGPRRDDAPAGRFAVTQRLSAPGGPLQVTLDARTDHPARLEVSLCRRHLLYEHDCRRASILVPAAPDWQHARLELAEAGATSRARGTDARTFSIRLLDAGQGDVAIDNLALAGQDAANLLRNGDFARGAAHWFPLARDDYVPWHIDNLGLELLIEEGIVGLATFSLLMAVAFVALLGRNGPRQDEAAHVPCLAGALAGGLLVGTVSSVLDMPRVAFLLFFLAFLSVQLSVTSSSAKPA